MQGTGLPTNLQRVSGNPGKWRREEAPHTVISHRVLTSRLEWWVGSEPILKMGKQRLRDGTFLPKRTQRKRGYWAMNTELSGPGAMRPPLIHKI